MRWAFVCLGLLVLSLVGCGDNGTESAKGAEGAPAKLEKFRFAVFPTDDGIPVETTYEPVRAKLEKDLGIPVSIVRVSDYSAVIEALRGKKVELGFFGPLSYVLAKREANAEAFAAGVGKTGNGVYHSTFMVKTDSPYHKLEDLKGKRIALVDPASTSGSLLPHYIILTKMGMELETYFSKVDYAGTHPAALKEVANGTVDVAGVEDELAPRMEQAGLIPKNSVREIFRSEDLPPSPIAYRKDMEPEIKKKVLDSFLSMPPSQPIKGVIAVDHYRKVDEQEYALVESLLDKLKVSRDAVLKKK
jgi:phosphonate transport system substrate-binding protein